MGKYLQIIKTSFYETMTYQLDFFANLFGELLMLLIMYFLTLAFYNTNSTIAGFNQSELLTYFLLTRMIRNFTLSGKVARDFSHFVREGILSSWLIKPLGIHSALFYQRMTKKMIKSILPLIILGLIYILPTGLFITPKNIVPFLMSFIVATITSYFIYSIIGTIAFWTTNTWGMISIYGRIVDVFSGGLIPLDLIPKQWLWIFNWLPFKYMHYIPLMIILGKIPAKEITQAIFTQTIWLIFVFIVFKYTWRKGVRHYDAVGH